MVPPLYVDNHTGLLVGMTGSGTDARFPRLLRQPWPGVSPLSKSEQAIPGWLLVVDAPHGQEALPQWGTGRVTRRRPAFAGC
jgi:hypothetical protein